MEQPMRRMTRLSLTAALAALALAAPGPAPGRGTADEGVVASPDGGVQFRLVPRDAARLAYRVTSRGRPVIEESALGVTVDGADLGAGAAVGAAERYRLDEKFPAYGGRSELANRCNGA